MICNIYSIRSSFTYLFYNVRYFYRKIDRQDLQCQILLPGGRNEVEAVTDLCLESFALLQDSPVDLRLLLPASYSDLVEQYLNKIQSNDPMISLRTLNSLKSREWFPSSSTPLKIFLILLMLMSSVIALKKVTTSSKVRQPLSSVSIWLNKSKRS